jgi:hypothetical protein
MTKLEALKDDVDKFVREVQLPVKANKGGDTWKQIQAVANAVPAATLTQIAYIKQMQASPDKTNDLPKIPGYLKTMKDQFAVIKLAAVTKYKTEHGPGGVKTRGMLSTAKSKKEEAERVALCDKLISQHAFIKRKLDAMRTPADLA